LQCVAVCCSVLQCVAVCCGVLQCRVKDLSDQTHGFQCVVVVPTVPAPRVLQRVAVCCCVL